MPTDGQRGVATWQPWGPGLQSIEDISTGTGWLGVDYTTGCDTRWPGRVTLGPLLTSLDCSGAGGTTANANGLALSNGMNATKFIYVIRGTKWAKIKASDMSLISDGTETALGEAATSILYTKTAAGTEEISFGMAATAYRVITTVGNTTTDTHSANSSSKILRIFGKGSPADTYAGLGQTSSVENTIYHNVLSGSTTMAAPNWVTRATLTDSIQFTGFGMSGNAWVPGTNDGPYVLDNDFQRFKPLIPELDLNTNHCFPGETRVRPIGMVSAVSRRRYSGKVVKLTTASGHHLTATPNHPVLSNRGWVAAGTLRKGDKVFSYSLRERGTFVDPDVVDIESPIEKVFDLCKLAGGRVERVLGAPVQFHGDGSDGEVEVVSVDRKLWLGVVAALRQNRAKDLLSSSDKVHSLADSEAVVGSLVGARSSAAPCIEHGGCDSPALFGRQALVAQAKLFGGASALHSRLHENTEDGHSAHPERVSDLLQGLTRNVPADNVHTFGRIPPQVEPAQIGLSGECPADALALVSESDPGLLEGSVDSRVADPKFFADSTGRQPFLDVEADSLVAVDWATFDGHVYNLTTSSGEYLAESITVHNCAQMDTWKLLNGLIIPLNNGLLLMRNEAQTSSFIGVEKYPFNTSPITGRVSALAGTPRWLYLNYYNPVTTDTYLMAARPRQAGDPFGQEVVYFPLAKMASTASNFLSNIGTYGSRTLPTLVMGKNSDVYWFSEGRLDQFPDDTSYTYAASGSLYLTEMRREPHWMKEIDYVEFETAGCTSTETITMKIGYDGNATAQVGAAVTSNGLQRFRMPKTGDAKGRRIKLQFDFARGGTTTATPQIVSTVRVGFHYRALVVDGETAEE